MAYISSGDRAAPWGRAFGGDRPEAGMLRLELSGAQWQNFEVQQQLARYIRVLNSVKRVSDAPGGERDFTFTLGSSTLKVPLDEGLEVHVDGQRIGSFRQPFIQAAVTIAADPGQFFDAGAGGTSLGTSGMASFEDRNGVAPHFARVMPHERNLLEGTVDALVEPADSAAGRAEGLLSWRYRWPGGTVRYLACGVSRTERFIITDPHRRSLQWLLCVVVTGTHDQPLLRGSVARLEVSEDLCRSPLGASGILAVDDLVRSDGLGVEVMKDGRNRLGGELEVVVDAANPFADTERTTVYWSYSVPRRFALRPGEVVFEQFTVTFVGSDSRPGQQRLTLSVTGTGGEPEIDLAAVEAVATLSRQVIATRREAGPSVTVWRLSGG